LLLVLGEATRLAEYFTNQDKVYRAELTLGYTSTTYDWEGEVSSNSQPFQLTPGEVETALEHFRGTIWQQVPVYSAVSVGGKRLYKMARRGLPVKAPIRQVTISSLSQLPSEPLLTQGSVVTLEVHCSKGTYIRSLANDIGSLLGCGALLSNLVRLTSGTFRLQDSYFPDEIVNRWQEGQREELLAPLDLTNLGLSWLELLPGEEVAISRGQSLKCTKERLNGLLSEGQELLLISQSKIIGVGAFYSAYQIIRTRKAFNNGIMVNV